MSSLYIPPSWVTQGVFFNSGARQAFTPVAASQAPTPSPDPARNLLVMSPPTILEAYELYAVSIAWGGLILAGAAGGTVTAELRLLVNDERRWSTDDTVTLNNYFSGAWTADLVNPITVGARERLGLQVTVETDGNGAPVDLAIMLAAYPNGNAANISPADWNVDQSTISYHTLTLPASRRL